MEIFYSGWFWGCLVFFGPMIALAIWIKSLHNHDWRLENADIFLKYYRCRGCGEQYVVNNLDF